MAQDGPVPQLWRAADQWFYRVAGLGHKRGETHDKATLSTLLVQDHKRSYEVWLVDCS